MFLILSWLPSVTDCLNPSQLYVGGVIEKNLPHLPTTPNFRGCLENVFINDVNIIDKAQREESDIYIPRKVELKTNHLVTYYLFHGENHNKWNDELLF